MKLDDVLRDVGEFGPYQRRLYVAICLPMAFHAIQAMSSIFTLGIPDHRCAIPGLDNDTYAVQSSYHEELIALYIPSTSDGYSECEIYDIEAVGNTTYLNLGNNTSNRSEIECQQWVYDKSVFQDTVITETNLVCSKSIYRAHATTAYFVGGLCALAIFGATSDRFGRKTTSYILLVCMLTSSLLLLWLPNITTFIAFRLLNGFSFGGFFNLSFVYVMEFIGPSKRGTWGLFSNNFWGIGVLIQGGIAYGIRSWRYLQMAFSLPILVFIAYWWLLPESPRWLYTKGHTRRGDDVLKVIAKGNGVDIDLDSIPMDKEEESDKSSSGNILDFLKLLKNKTLAIRSCVVFWNWFVVAMLFFGIGLNVPNLGGDLYVNFTISAVMEVVGYTLSIPLMNYLGRKRSYVIVMCVGGASLLLTIIPELLGDESTKWVVNAAAMLGKLVSSAAFAMIFVFTSELFPTVIRSTVMTTSGNMGSIGSILAPYVVELANLLDGQLASVTPMLIFGAVTLSAGLLALVLPETAGTNLPDNIEDMLQKKRPDDHNPAQTPSDSYASPVYRF